MTLQATYLGAGSIGASELAPLAEITYTVPITVASDSWLVAIESAWKAPLGSTANFRLTHAVYEDNAGEPGLLLNSYLGLAQPTVIDATARWVTLAIGVWLPAGNYHIGAGFPVTAVAGRLMMTTGGASGDGHTVDSGGGRGLIDGDYSAATITATTSTYSIRAVLISEVGGQNIPVGQVVEAELGNPITPLIGRVIPLGQAVEVELAGVITPVRPTFVPVQTAVERELAQIVTPVKGVPVQIGSTCEVLSPTAICEVTV